MEDIQQQLAELRRRIARIDRKYDRRRDPGAATPARAAAERRLHARLRTSSRS